jgi:hypothetical protein
MEINGYRPQGEVTLDALVANYRRQQDAVPIHQAEYNHAVSLSREAFAMFMSWADVGVEAEPAVYEGVLCNTFELAVAEITGHYAKERLKHLQPGRKTGIGVVFKKLFGPKQIPDELELYAGDVTRRTLVRMREFDDNFAAWDWEDIPPGRAALEVTVECLQAERQHYL